MKVAEIPADYHYKALNNGFIVRRFWYENKFRFLDNKASFEERDTLLDVGCGSGNITLNYAQYLKMTVGLDINLKAIRFAQEIGNRGRGKLGFVNASFGNLPFKDETFNKVVLFEVLEHCNFVCAKELLSEVRRVLKPQGEVFLTVPNDLSLWPFIEKMSRFLNFIIPLRDLHKLKFTPKRIKELVGTFFTIEEIGTFNHLSPFLSIISYSLAEKCFKWEINSLTSFGLTIWARLKKEGR